MDELTLDILVNNIMNVVDDYVENPTEDAKRFLEKDIKNCLINVLS